MSTTTTAGETSRPKRDPDLIEIDLSQIAMILRKHRWFIGLTTLLVTALAFTYVQLATPLYTAKATLLLDREAKGMPGLEELYGFTGSDKEYFQTQFEILKSRELAERVVEELKLDNNIAFNAVRPSVSSRIARLAGSGLTVVSEAIADATNGVLDPYSPGKNDSAPMAEQPQPVVLPDFLDRQLEDNSLKYYDPEFLDTLMRLVDGLGVSAVPRTKLIELSFTSHEPQFAAYIPNALGLIYVESQQDNRTTETDKQSEWLVERLDSLEQQLEESEAKLQAFKKENRLVDIDGEVTRFNEQELLNLSSKLLDAERELAESKALYEQIQELDLLFADERQLALENIPPVQSNAVVREYKIDRSVLEREIDELRTRYGEKHPRMLDASARLAVIQRNIELEVERVVGSITTEFELNQKHVYTLQYAVRKGKEEIETIGEKSFELGQLQREVDANRNLYETFFNRYRETSETRSLDNASALIVEQAVVPLNPSAPNKKLILALAFVGSLIGSAIVAVIREALDSSIDTIGGLEKIESKLGAPLVGIVPLKKSQKRTEPVDPASLKDQSDFAFSESIRRIAASILIGPGSKENKVVLISSSVPNEGKTSTAINLAYELSKSEKVLLIDCDLRKPSVQLILGSSRETQGLSNMLRDSERIELTLRESALGSLDILPAGSERKNVQQLLVSSEFINLIETMRASYDRIVIDAPPVHAVSDPLHIAEVSDCVIYVVKSNETPLKLVENGITQIEKSGAHIHGLVVTMVDIEKAASYGGNYYSGYYDYYGYAK